MEIGKVPNLDANHLIVFYVAATEANLTSAANKLNLSQPTINYHIKCLEESVHLKLIGFKKQKIVCTPAGESILQYAGEVYKQMVNVENMIEFLKKSNLKVGIGPIYLPVITPVLRTIFEDQFPKVKLIIKSETAFDMIEDVINYNLDLVIVQRWNYDDKILKYIPVSNPERLVCYVSPKHPLCLRESVEWKDLCDYPIIMGPATTAMHVIVSAKLDSLGLTKVPQFAVEVHNTEASKGLVENSSGISFSLIKGIEKEVSEGRLKILPLKDEISITADAVLRKDTYMHPIINNFISMVRQAFGYTAKK
jgi:LysR family transcriptional regulator, transcriptional activator of the cysJI operon